MMMLRRILAGLCLALLLAVPAEAQMGRRIILFGGVPAWVKSGASVDMDFANGRYFGCSLASCFSLTRASAKTNLLPSSASGFVYTTFGSGIPAIDSNGWLQEEARTNQLLNSTAPATQTTASLGTGTYTLWVNGSGSATMSAGTGTGCGTGAATNGTPVNFTITIAGTCTVTVSGSLNAFQLEQNTPSAAQGTSFIVTAASPVTRAGDAVTMNAPLSTTIASGAASLVLQTNLLANGGANAATLIMRGANSYVRSALTNKVDYWNNVADLQATLGSGTLAGSLVKTGMSWSGTGRSLVANNGTVATDAGVPGTAGTVQFGTGGQSPDGYISRLTVWSSRLPDATLKAFTQ